MNNQNPSVYNKEKENNNGKKKIGKEDKIKKEEEYVKISSKEEYPWDKNDESPDDSKFNSYKKYYNYFGLREKGAMGLKNLQNTCFMNSSLQCLSHIKILYNKLKGYKIKGKNLTKYFIEMLNLMHETKEIKAYEPKDIFGIICLKYPKYKSYQQQDANEFISNFLSTLNDELNSKNFEKIKNFDISNGEMKEAFNDFYFYKENISPIIDIFYGNFININKCQKGHITSYDFNAFNMLELSIFNLRKENMIDLESLIKQSIKYGPLGIDEFCPSCKEKSPSFLGIEILNAPNILIIFINRVINNVYYNNFITFPQILNLEDFILEDKNLSKNFEIIGVINHSGSAQFGHYTAECKNFIDKKWYYFNDSWVSNSELNDKKERYISSNALILFYQRINKNQ